MPPSARPRRARRSCTCTRAIRSTAGRRRIPSTSASSRPTSASRSNVVINFTTGGAATMTIQERLRPALELKPEVASLNMGSMNFGLYPMLERFREFKFDWERDYLQDVRRPRVQEHVQGHRVHPDLLRGQRHALRDRVLRHRPPVHRASLLRRAASSSRRSSSRACSASSAASARIRTTSRT